jgi:retinol dehydrogenase-12
MNGRVALITGATDGIGKATARRLLADGWDVVVIGRSCARCDATVAELRAVTPNARVSAILADLSVMDDVQNAASQFLSSHDRLDLLLLNANSITQEHVRTRDGFEANLAVGYLARVHLAWALEDLLRKTPGSQVLTVVGLNLERIDFEDPSTPEGFSSMTALGRWQWAIQVFAREWNRRLPAVAMNVYMPGLVRTKILADEPQPMRLVAQIANLVVGVPADKSGNELATVIEDIRRHGRRDAYYTRTKLKPPRDLGEQAADGTRLWALTERLLQLWRTENSL